MGRALKILAYAVILFLTYLVITAVLKSCNNDNHEVASAEVENATGESDAYEDDYFEDGLESEDEGGSEGDDFFSTTDNVEDIDYKEIDNALEKTKIKKKENKPSSEVDYTTPSQPKSLPRSNTSSGDFLVIAGSYIININAENMVLKLKRMGYDNAEIVIFDQSQYHTVVAQRSPSYDKALTSANGLKSKGIDSYVHTKKD